MGNQRPEKQLADLESGMISEESPNCGDSSQILDEFDNNQLTAIDVETLLAEADIDLSAFLSRATMKIEGLQNLNRRKFAPQQSLETLSETDLMLLSDNEVLCYLEAEGIDCDAFLESACSRIKNRTATSVVTNH